MKKLIFTVSLLIFMVACDNGSGDGNLTGNGDGGTTLELTSADFSTVAPCPEQGLLTDATQLETLKTAILNGILTYKDVPFDGNDVDNFKKKCGLEGFWDPAIATDSITLADKGMTAVSISQFWMTGNLGICTTGSEPTNYMDGFPLAGTYRKEFKVTDQTSTYLIRTRSVVSGSAAGATFQSLSLSTGDIENTLVYKINDSTTAHSDLWSSGINSLSVATTSVPSFTLTVTNAATEIWKAETKFICADML